MRHAGHAVWTRDGGYKLGMVDDADPFAGGDPRVWLPDGVEVAPGETHRFDFQLTAPLEAGRYVTDWRMVHEGVRWFGETAQREIDVACPPAVGRAGRVRLEGNALVDDDGAFNALGATMMWAAWAFRHDRPRLERNLAFLLQVYAGDIADLATIHFDRNIRRVEGPWRPVRQPWEYQFCEGLPVGSNNEPIGPGASVASENEPVRLVAAAITTYVSGLPMYVYHTRAGVRGDEDLSAAAGAASFGPLRALLPGDLPAWSRRNAHWDNAPFQPFAGDADGALHADTMWPDLDGPTSGAVRAYGAVRGDEFLVFPIGILDHVTLAPRRDLEMDVIDPMTGLVLEHLVLGAGERFDLRGAEALLLRGQFR